MTEINMVIIENKTIFKVLKVVFKFQIVTFIWFTDEDYFHDIDDGVIFE